MWLHSDPWAEALRSVLEVRFGTLDDSDFTAEALQACEETMHNLGYTHVERWGQTYTETVDIDFVVGHMLSAISSEQIPSVERQGFADDVKAAIGAVTPSGRVVETVSVRAVIGRTHV